MTRKQRNTVEYFPHDARASEGDTLTIMESQFGNDGYAFWFKLLERLATTEGHCIDCKDGNRWQLLCARAHSTTDKAITMVEMLATLNAIDPDLWKLKLIWCQNLVDNVSDVYRNRRREIPQKPITTPKNGITTPKNGITTPKNPQSKVKESKVKESIYTTEFFEQFWLAYPKKKSKGQAERAFARINPDEQLLAQMIAIIERAKKSVDWQKEGGKYIPYPATWLNARGWEDVIEIGGTDARPKGYTRVPRHYTRPEDL